MSSIFGGGGNNKQGVSTTGYGLTGGGFGAPWNWGVSPFDQTQIDQATADNTTAMKNRYQQLGLGGSTMEGQDVAGTNQAGQAMTGQLQTQNVSNPALNPALQPILNTIIGPGGVNSASGLSSLAGQALGAGLNAAGTAAGSAAAGTAAAGSAGDISAIVDEAAPFIGL